MSEVGHTLSWKATGVLAAEHLSLERTISTSQQCLGACAQLLICFSTVCKGAASYAICFIPGLSLQVMPLFQELTVETCLEMRAFRGLVDTEQKVNVTTSGHFIEFEAYDWKF